jgi:hypothetical protein
MNLLNRAESIPALLLKLEELLESPVFFFDYEPVYGRLRLVEETPFLKTLSPSHLAPIEFTEIGAMLGVSFAECSEFLRANREFRSGVMRAFQIGYFEAFPWCRNSGGGEGAGLPLESGKRFQGIFLVLHPRPSCLSSANEEKIRALLQSAFASNPSPDRSRFLPEPSL